MKQTRTKLSHDQIEYLHMLWEEIGKQDLDKKTNVADDSEYRIRLVSLMDVYVTLGNILDNGEYDLVESRFINDLLNSPTIRTLIEKHYEI